MDRVTADGDPGAGLLGKIKNALRVTVSDLDEELSDIIEACFDDLRRAGVREIAGGGPQVIRAAILYAKAHFSFSADGERFHRQYDAVKNLLRLTNSGA